MIVRASCGNALTRSGVAHISAIASRSLYEKKQICLQRAMRARVVLLRRYSSTVRTTRWTAILVSNAIMLT